VSQERPNSLSSDISMTVVPPPPSLRDRRAGGGRAPPQRESRPDHRPSDDARRQGATTRSSLPGWQGRGIGSALEFAFEHVRESGVAIVLETGTPRNVPLYERLGFHVVEEADPPEGGPHVWSCAATRNWREPAIRELTQSADALDVRALGLITLIIVGEPWISFASSTAIR
jgi:GNAT superfamily N-acetyltransferase